MDPFDDVSGGSPGVSPENPSPVMPHQPACENEEIGEGLPLPPGSLPSQSEEFMQLDSFNGIPIGRGLEAHHAMPSSDQSESVQGSPQVQPPMQKPEQQRHQNSMVSQNEGGMMVPPWIPPPPSMPQHHDMSAEEGLPPNEQHDIPQHTSERPSPSQNVMAGKWQNESDDPHRKATIQHM